MEQVRESYDRYSNELSGGDVTEKQVMAAAVLLAADEAVTRLFFPEEAPLRAKELADYLKTRAEADINRRAYEYLLETCQMNPTRFMSGEDNKGELWGGSDQDYYYIFRLQVQKICAEGGYNDAALLAWMKEEGLIEWTKGNLKTKKINGSAVSCVWLKKHPDGFFPVEEDGTEPF